MRGQLFVTALLAVAVTACGSGSHSNKNADLIGNSVVANGGEATGVVENPAPPNAGKSKQVAQPLVVKPTYVKPTAHATKSRKAPAVVLLPDTADRASADNEANKLAKIGIGAFVVAAPASAPTDPTAFDRVVGTALKAVKMLRRRNDVDRRRIGFIGEGVGAHVGAVAIGRDPDSITAAVLADIGGVVVPSSDFAPERWLEKAHGTQLLFQRDTAKRAMTDAEVKRLLTASPPGTLMEQYKVLGSSAQLSRDKWIKRTLLAG
jgi:hypothetical protein